MNPQKNINFQNQIKRLSPGGSPKPVSTLYSLFAKIDTNILHQFRFFHQKCLRKIDISKHPKTSKNIQKHPNTSKNIQKSKKLVVSGSCGSRTQVPQVSRPRPTPGPVGGKICNRGGGAVGERFLCEVSPIENDFQIYQDTPRSFFVKKMDDNVYLIN